MVRRCVSKRTRHAFALKIIDKSKCQGKEHMIESEVKKIENQIKGVMFICVWSGFQWFFSFQIAILNLVSHPHIIELIEVFDFFNEKYLVTELVPGKSMVVLD